MQRLFCSSLKRVAAVPLPNGNTALTCDCTLIYHRYPAKV